MRVGISGVSSTGKSSLVREVASRTGYPALLDTDLHQRAFRYLEEEGRAPHTRFFPHMTPEEHIDFELAAYKLWLEDEAQTESFISDETPLDFMNYFMIFGAPHVDLLPPQELEEMLNVMKGRLAKFDVIWYLPRALKPKDDGRRFTHDHLLEHWDNALRGLFESTRVGWLLEDKLRIMEPTDVFENRVQAVMDSIAVAAKAGN